jgi:hypothetical protein
MSLRIAPTAPLATVAPAYDTIGDPAHSVPAMLADAQRVPVRARARWSTPALLAVVTVIVRVPAFVSAPSLVFDDGQYGVSVVDMRHGLAPYRGVFSSQGPLHYPLLYVGDLLGFRTIDAPRVTPVLAGVVATIGVWAIARRLGASDAVATVSGLIVATTGTMIWTTGQVTGDGPAAGLVVCALWAAIVYRDDPRLGRALLVGVSLGAALAVKPLVGAALIPIGWWMGERRRVEHLAAASGAAVAVWFASAVPWGLGRVWRQSITYHTGKGPEYGKLFQFRRLTSLLGLRDGILVAAVVLGVIAAAIGATRVVETRRRDALVIAIWAGAVAVLLVFEKAMFANHLATLVIPLALLFVIRPPPLRWLAIGLIALVPWAIVNTNDMLWFRHYTGIDAELVADLQRLPPAAKAVADDPAYVWRAGLSTPRLMNDVSKMRIDQRSLTTSDVVDAARARGTCAVVIWTFRFGSLLAGLRDGIRSAGYELARQYAPDHELWLKADDAPNCRTRGGAAPARSHD